MARRHRTPSIDSRCEYEEQGEFCRGGAYVPGQPGFVPGGPFGPNALYGLQSFVNSSNYLITPTGGGEVGNATGFGACALVRINALTTGNQGLITRQNASQGYALYIDSNSRLTAIVYSGAGATVTAPIRQLLPSDVGRVFLMMVQSTGTAVREWCDRAVTGAGVAITGYTAPTANQTTAFGTINNVVVNAAQGLTILSAMAFTGSPSDAQLQGYYDAARLLGDLPDTMQGATVTHLWSVKRELNGTVVASGQTAPAQLTDRVTNAAGDALARVGTPTVKIIDPTIEGRRTLGAQGFSPANYLASVAGAGLRGSLSGHWCAWAGRIDNLINGTGAAVFMETLELGSPAGFTLFAGATNFGNIGYQCVNAAGGFVTSSLLTLATVDTSQPIMLVGVHTGSQLRLYIKRANQALVQVGSDVAITGYKVPTSAAKHVIGNRDGGSVPTYNSGWFGAAGGDGFVPTLAELQQLGDDWDRTGQLGSIAGKTSHAWTPTLDILASGVDVVPATVLDRVGTDNLTKVGIAVRTDANSIRSVGPYGAADGWQTAPGGGIQGANSGFHVVVDVVFTKIPTATEELVSCANSGATTGWVGQVATNALRLNIGGVVLSSAYTVTAGDLNVRRRIIFQKTATAAQTWVNGVQAGSDVAAASFNVNTNVAMIVGSFYGAGNFSSGYIECVTGGNASLTSGEIATVCADLTQAPPNVTGKTLKRWVFEQDIAAVSGALPARSVERISGGDDLARLGSPLVLAQRTERVWSYETAPIWYGAQGATGACYSIAGGFAGDPAAFGGVWIGTIDSQSVASQTRFLCGKRDLGSGFPGFQLATISTNSAFQFTVGSSTASVSPSTSAIAASELGKTFAVFFWFDGSKAHMAVRRVEIGTGSSALTGAYSPSSQPFTLCARADASLPADGTTTRGFIALNGAPTLSEVQALHDAITANESIPLALPRTLEVYDLTKDVKANGGSLPSTLVGRVAGQNLTQTGSPTLGSSYARAAS